jgi:hypothetical protein
MLHFSFLNSTTSVGIAGSGKAGQQTRQPLPLESGAILVENS